MFTFIMGSLLLLFTAGLIIHYRPKTFSSWYVCLLCGLTGVISMVTGGEWLLQLIQVSAQLLIAGCGLFHLHREKIFMVRKTKVAKVQQKLAAATSYAEAKRKCVPVFTYGEKRAVQQSYIPQQAAESLKRCA